MNKPSCGALGSVSSAIKQLNRRRSVPDHAHPAIDLMLLQDYANKIRILTTVLNDDDFDRVRLGHDGPAFIFPYHKILSKGR